MNKQLTLRKSVVVGCSAAALSMLAFSVQALPMVKNGSFENATTTGILASPNFEIPVGTQTNLPDWTVVGTPKAMTFLDCLVFAAFDPTLHVCGGSPIFKLHKNPGLSPSGGNYIAFDGDPEVAHSISQVINDLTVGQLYDVKFYQAAAQLIDREGDTTEWWDVSLGSEQHASKVMGNKSKSFVAWNSQKLTFTAKNTTDTLRFFAKGSPGGLPPFVLLDGVSITAVPEPETLALLGIGLLGILAARRQKKVCA